MSLFDIYIIQFLEATALAIVSIDPIGAIRLFLLASDLRTGWRS
jgi:hypothetical protein